MFKYLMIISLIVLASCSKKLVPQTQTIIKENVVEKTVYVPKDSIVKVPGDSVTLHDTIPCPGVNYHKEVMSKKGITKATVDIHNNQLSVDCKTDSLSARIQWLEAHSDKVTTKTETTTITLPAKRYIPKWVYWLAGINLLYVTARILIWRYKIPLSI